VATPAGLRCSPREPSKRIDDVADGHDSDQAQGREKAHHAFLLFFRRVARTKTLAGCRWHQQEQYWTVSQTNGSVTPLLTLVAKEATEVIPSLDTA
jgi:hypothetical protein